MALELRKYGITQVHPLLGGFDGWVGRGYPVEPVEENIEASGA